MILLSGIVSAIFLSPLLFVLLLAGGIALLAVRKRAAALWLISATAALLLLLSLPAVRYVVLRPLERAWPPFPSNPPAVDAIVALGAGVRQGAADMPGELGLTEDSRARVVYAAILHRRLGVPIIVSGGTTWQERFARSEAEVAAAILVSLGVPEADVLQEGASRTTWENASGVLKLLRARGMTRIALVTSAVHMPRAILAFSRFGIDCVPAPTLYLAQTSRPTAVDFLPSFESLQEIFVGLREYLGIVFYEIMR
jgi:uncharacterized SAM-binding protein YcdF (DUF218 family)